MSFVDSPIRSADEIPPFVDGKFVQQRYGIKHSTYHKLLASGRIQSLKIGRLRRVTRAALLAFEASLTGGDLAE